MVEIAFDRLPLELDSIREDESIAAAIERIEPALLLAGRGAEDLTEILANQAHEMAVVLLGDGEAPEETTRVSVPFQTQGLIRAVYGALGREIPDENLFAAFDDQIPLARGGSGESAVKAEAPAESSVESADLVGLETVVDLDERASVDNTLLGPPRGTISLPVDELDILEESVIDEPEDELSPSTKTEAPAARSIEASVLEASASAVEGRLSAPEVEALTRKVIEEVVWDVVPRLAEAMLKEEISRLVRESESTG
jgi:hypothetical protein